MELTDEDQDLARSVADSLKRQVPTRQIAEIKKQTLEQRRRNRQKDLEIGRKNDQKKATWVLQTLKLQKKLHETRGLIETAKVQWKLEKIKLKNALTQLEHWQREEEQFRLEQAEKSWRCLMDFSEPALAGLEKQSPSRLVQSVLEEEVTGVPLDLQQLDMEEATTPRKGSSRVVITEQMRSVIRSRLNDWNSCEVRRKLVDVVRTLHAFIKTLRNKVGTKPPSEPKAPEVHSFVEESSSSAPNSSRSNEESPLKLIKNEQPRRPKWHERLCRCICLRT
jgi:hypothetical protein